LYEIGAWHQWEASESTEVKVLTEPNGLDITIGWLHGSAQGPLGIAALFLLVLLLKWRAR
jgi:hypothetical protein